MIIDSYLFRQSFLGGMCGLSLAVVGGVATLLLTSNRLPSAVYALAPAVGVATGAGLAIEGRSRKKKDSWRSVASDESYRQAVGVVAEELLGDVITEIYSLRAIAGYPKELQESEALPEMDSNPSPVDLEAPPNNFELPHPEVDPWENPEEREPPPPVRTLPDLFGNDSQILADFHQV